MESGLNSNNLGCHGATVGRLGSHVAKVFVPRQWPGDVGGIRIEQR